MVAFVGAANLRILSCVYLLDMHLLPLQHTSYNHKQEVLIRCAHESLLEVFNGHLNINISLADMFDERYRVVLAGIDR